MDSTPDREQLAESGTEQSPGGAAAQAPPEGAGSAPAAAPALAKWLLIYSLLRIGTLAVLAAGLSLLMPLILALLFAVVLALPLSWVLFAGPRRRVNEAMAITTAHRRAERERLRAALDGNEVQ